MLILCAATLSDTSVWLTDIATAKSQAKEGGKLILLSFSGSDWCGNCMRLEQVLFEAPEFQQFASEHLILVNADFPMRKKNKLSDEQTMKNEALAELYNKAGSFPKVLILDADGKIVDELVHPKDDAQSYLKQLKSLTH